MKHAVLWGLVAYLCWALGTLPSDFSKRRTVQVTLTTERIDNGWRRVKFPKPVEAYPGDVMSMRGFVLTPEALEGACVDIEFTPGKTWGARWGRLQYVLTPWRRTQMIEKFEWRIGGAGVAIPVT